MSSRTATRSSTNVGCLIVVGIAVVLVLGSLLFAPYYFTQLWWVFRQTWFWLVPLLVLVGMILLAMGRSSNGLRIGPLVLLIIAGFIGFVLWLFMHSYAQSSVYAESLHVTPDPAPALAVRAPFSVSAAQVNSNLGAISGNTQTTMYVPQTQSFETLVEQRGFATGYQALLTQQIGDTGRNKPSTCTFDQDKASARLNGEFDGNLGRQINETQRFVNWDYADAYGWCDAQGTPFVITPLVEQEGWMVVTEKPAGIALYNGRTGEMDIRPTAAGLPGPTYPLHLAELQRESSHVSTGFWDYVFGRSGWELPDEEGSINSSNLSEFVLAGQQGGTEFYVTPETSRGSATAISVLTVMSAQLTSDELAPITVHQLGAPAHPVWQSVGAIEQRVKGDFGDVFAQQRTAEIFELAPTGSDTWVATIGTPQNILYRVTGRGDLTQPPCLLNLDSAQLRCGPSGNIGLATGSTPTATTPQVTPAAPDADLSKLTPPQLVDLADRANKELARRVPAGA